LFRSEKQILRCALNDKNFVGVGHRARTRFQIASWQCMPGDPLWYCLTGHRLFVFKLMPWQLN
jgi:hypothetical protein